MYILGLLGNANRRAATAKSRIQMWPVGQWAPAAAGSQTGFCYSFLDGDIKQRAKPGRAGIGITSSLNSFFVEATMIPRLIFLFIASTSFAAAVPHSGTRLATVSIAESDKNAGYVIKMLSGFCLKKNCHQS